MSESIERTKAKLGDAGYELPTTADLCAKALVSCTRQLKAALQEEIATRHLRLQHQTTLIQTHQANGNSKLAKKIRGIQRAEEVKQVFQHCQAARQLGSQGGLTHVLTPTNPTDSPRTCEDWTRVDCPNQMTKLLMYHNRTHFGQSKGCMLTSPPLNVTMEFTATCPRAEAILNGTFLQPHNPAPPPRSQPPSQDDSSHSESLEPLSAHDPSDTPSSDDETDSQEPPPHHPQHLLRHHLPDLAQLLVDSLRLTTTPDVIAPEITAEEYRAKLKVWNECTSTSPTSNMHLGHLKAYWAEHTLQEDSDDAKDLEAKRRCILDGHILLLNYAL